MARYLVWRLLWTIPTIVLVAVSVFALIRLIPGDPALLILGDRATPETLLALREHLGLDQSMPLQFLIWSANVFHGDLGRSILNDQPVLPMIVDRFLVSIQLVVPAVVFAALVAVPLGLIAAWKQDSTLDAGIVAWATSQCTGDHSHTLRVYPVCEASQHPRLPNLDQC